MVRTTAVQTQLNDGQCKDSVQSGTTQKRLTQTEHNLCVQNGNLTAGDQLLSVDGQSLVGLNQER